MFPTTRVAGLAERLHGIAYDNGFIRQVTGRSPVASVPRAESYLARKALTNKNQDSRQILFSAKSIRACHAANATDNDR